MAPAFLNFFSKRENPKARRKSSDLSSRSRPKSPTSVLPTSSAKSTTSPSIGDASEQFEGSQLSLETEYVLADADSPTLNSSVVYPQATSSNAASVSATRLKMPFRRKQSASSKLATVASQSPASPILVAKDRHKLSGESTVSESPSLLPPPSRSAIFGSYADPHNALSTRSLPQDAPPITFRRSLGDVLQNYETMSNPDIPAFTAPPSKQQPSKGGLFSWARPRGRTKSKPSPPNPSGSSPPVLTLPPSDSFNLRGFRHVTSPAPEILPSTSPPGKDPLPRPRSRVRESSSTSDSSQRISVAAFREAQARRSTADSPVPSLPGDRDSFASSQVRNRRRSSALGTPPSVPTPESHPRSSAPRNRPARRSTAPLSFSASMTSSESSEEEESESEEEATLRPHRKRTITGRSVQSELGHRSSPASLSNAARSDIGHGLPSDLHSRLSPSPRSTHYSPNLEASGSGSRTSGAYSRKRASLSTSALVPDAAAKRASVISKSSTASRLMQPPPRSRSRASTSSESSTESSSSEDAPLASLLPPQRPGSAMSRASGSPVRRPAKPLIDIEQLLGENSTLPPRIAEPSSDSSQHASQADQSTARNRKTSLGLGERLSALASGLGGLQASRPKSPESPSDPKDEAFTPPEAPETSPSPSPMLSPRSSPALQTKAASPALKPRANKSSSALRLKPSRTPKVDTLSLKLDSTGPPPPSSSTSSDAPIPYVTPTPIRERHEPPAFAVTSRPTSHASNLSLGTLAAPDKAVADTDSRPVPRRATPGIADQPKHDQQQLRRQLQEEPQTTVRVVRSVLPKTSREEPLPVPRPQPRTRAPSVGVTVSNIHLTPPRSSASTSPPGIRQVPGGGTVAPPRRPFALRDSSPVSSAGDSSSSRMPATPRDGSELGVGPTARPGHRKRASVTFVDELEDEREGRERERESRRVNLNSRPGHGKGPAAVASSSDEEDDREREAEEKRKERRRSEAKAAIELGNVINGTGPIDDDDDDDEEEQPMNVPPRMSMAMGMGMNPGNNIPFPSAVGPMGLQGQWGSQPGVSVGNPLASMSMPNFLNAGTGPGLAGGMNSNPGMNMGAGMVDPRVFAVHQQAMMIAKHTYQLAVAQQAMRDAAEEWERGSAISGWGGGQSSAGAPSMLGMGMNMNMNTNMGGGGGGGGGGMGGFPGAAGQFAMPGAGGMGWPGGPMPGFPGNPPRSMYGSNLYAASEIGGGGNRAGQGGWATSSVYGESFGAPRDRSSRALRQSQMMQAPQTGGGHGSGGATPALKRDSGRPRTRTAPSGPSGAPRATSTGPKKRPAEGGYGLVGTVSPPSSWKGPA